MNFFLPPFGDHSSSLLDPGSARARHVSGSHFTNSHLQKILFCLVRRHDDSVELQHIEIVGEATFG